MRAVDFLKNSVSVGRIVSSGDLSIEQISEAHAHDRFFVDDETGYGWAILPWELTTAKDKEREYRLAEKA
jgi:hypothetical protein